VWPVLVCGLCGVATRLGSKLLAGRRVGGGRFQTCGHACGHATGARSVGVRPEAVNARIWRSREACEAAVAVELAAALGLAPAAEAEALLAVANKVAAMLTGLISKHSGAA